MDYNQRGKKIAIYPGTFDPVTLGHADIIKRASFSFDFLVIAVANNSTKNTMFSIEDRELMLKNEVDDMNLSNVQVKSFQGLLVDFAAQNNANTIVRGLRALSDFEYEFKMAYINHKLNNGVNTIFMPATEEGHFISSSFVKEIARFGGSLDGLVSPKVKNIILSRINNN